MPTNWPVKRLDGSANGRFQLDHVRAGSQSFRIRNDLHVKSARLDGPLDGRQLYPKVIRIEILERFNWFEIFDVLRRHLSEFQ